MCGAGERHVCICACAHTYARGHASGASGDEGQVGSVAGERPAIYRQPSAPALIFIGLIFHSPIDNKASSTVPCCCAKRCPTIVQTHVPRVTHLERHGACGLLAQQLNHVLRRHRPRAAAAASSGSSRRCGGRGSCGERGHTVLR